MAKYLIKLSFYLSEPQYIVKSTKDFIKKIHNVNFPHGFNVFIYTDLSVPLEETINVALDRIPLERNRAFNQ